MKQSGTEWKEREGKGMEWNEMERNGMEWKPLVLVIWLLYINQIDGGNVFPAHDLW